MGDVSQGRGSLIMGVGTASLEVVGRSDSVVSSRSGEDDAQRATKEACIGSDRFVRQGHADSTTSMWGGVPKLDNNQMGEPKIVPI